jgi:hypothetical protein
MQRAVAFREVQTANQGLSVADGVEVAGDMGEFQSRRAREGGERMEYSPVSGGVGT